MLHVTYSEGGKQVTDFLTEDGTWVQIYGITSKRRKKAELSPNDHRHQICKPRFQSRKRVFSIFFDDQGSVSVDYLPANSTSQVHGMQNFFCPKSFRAVSTQSPPPRTSSSTTTPVPTKQGQKIEVAPCPSCLVGSLKGKLARGEFSHVHDLAKAVISELKTFPKEVCRKAFSTLFRHLRHWISAEVEHFDGMLYFGTGASKTVRDTPGIITQTKAATRDC